VAPPDISLNTIFSALWPFIMLQVVALAVVVSFPQITLWLPALN
jgi:TRAP-type mannitol/chloroaromatic compound transport system permease large subunit